MNLIKHKACLLRRLVHYLKMIDPSDSKWYRSLSRHYVVVTSVGELSISGLITKKGNTASPDELFGNPHIL